MKIAFRYIIAGILMTLFALASPMTQAQTNQPLDLETFSKEEVYAAVLAFFEGEDAEGLLYVIDKIFAEQGEPDAYFYGIEDEGEVEIGYRYGSGRLILKGIRDKMVYWKGPSVRFGNMKEGSKIFFMVYNLKDYKTFYKRFDSGETGYFFYKGAAMSYRGRLDLTIAQIKVGVDLEKGLHPTWIKFNEDELVRPNVLPD